MYGSSEKYYQVHLKHRCLWMLRSVPVWDGGFRLARGVDRVRVHARWVSVRLLGPYMFLPQSLRRRRKVLPGFLGVPIITSLAGVCFVVVFFN